MDILNKVVGIAVGLFVCGILLPLGLNQIANATMTNVDASVQTIVTVLLPVLAVVAIAIYFLRHD